MQEKCIFLTDNEKDLSLARKRLLETDSSLLKPHWQLEYILSNSVEDALNERPYQKLPNICEYKLMVIGAVHTINLTGLFLHPFARNNFCVAALGNTLQVAQHRGFRTGNYADLKRYVEEIEKKL